jgi:TolB-like protein
MEYKKVLVVFFLIFCIFDLSFAVDLPVVVVQPFKARNGISTDDAETITDIFMSELHDSDKISLLQRESLQDLLLELKFAMSDFADNDDVLIKVGKAALASYVIHGQISTLGGQIIVTANMVDMNTTKTLHTARMQLAGLNMIFDEMPKFVNSMVDKLPKRNYFIGTWTPKVEYGNAGAKLIFFEDETFIFNDLELIWDVSLKYIIDGKRCNAKRMFINTDLEGTYTYTDSSITFHFIFDCPLREIYYLEGGGRKEEDSWYEHEGVDTVSYEFTLNNSVLNIGDSMFFAAYWYETDVENSHYYNTFVRIN